MGQNGAVVCPRCGARIDALPCPVCGARAPSGAAGAPDYAGWWRRLAATVVDFVVLVVPQSVAYLVGDAVGTPATGGALALVVWGLYSVALVTRPRGQTLGNRVAGTRVRDATTLQPVAVGQSALRWLIMALYLTPGYSTASGSGAVRALGAVVAAAFLLDGLYPLVNARRQTWHDRLANTVVLRE